MYAKFVYNMLIRDHLPRKVGVFNGVPARWPRLFDMTDNLPYFKQGLIDAIQDHIEEGDTVELVGFGRGVSTVHTVKAGAAHVTAYEAAQRMVSVGEETLFSLNNIEDKKVDIRHALVGDAINIYGGLDGADTVSPETLTSADALVMDCEGSEIGILEGLGNWPKLIVVETHPVVEDPVGTVCRPIRDSGGYEIETYPYKPGYEDKKIVVASRR